MHIYEFRVAGNKKANKFSLTLCICQAILQRVTYSSSIFFSAASLSKEFSCSSRASPRTQVDVILVTALQITLSVQTHVRYNSLLARQISLRLQHLFGAKNTLSVVRLFLCPYVIDSQLDSLGAYCSSEQLFGL